MESSKLAGARTRADWSVMAPVTLDYNTPLPSALPSKPEDNVRTEQTPTFEMTDLADLGDLEYGFVTREEGGRVTRLSLRAKGPLRVDRLAWAGEGDAPGSDPRLAPRPPSSTRSLSVVVGDRRGVFVYESASRADVILAALDASMRARGARPATEPGPRARAYTFGLAGPLVTCTVSARGAGEVVTVVESR